MSDATRYPLSWPAGRPRSGRRLVPVFKPGSFAAMRDGLLAELVRFGAVNVVLSTNVSLRQDGLPLAGQRQPADPGVAVYFRRKDRDLCLACDRWATVEANMRAVADVVEAIRLIGRRGTGDMVDAAFTGFTALPAGPRWWEVLGVDPDAPTDAVRDHYSRLVMQHHPDRGGDPDRMARINVAYGEFRKLRGV